MEKIRFCDYTEEEIINRIKGNEIEEDLRELLISAINCNKNKVARYLIDLNVVYDYMNYYEYDAYITAVSRGNIEIIELLEKKGLNLLKVYNIDSQEQTALSFIRDLDTLKYFESKKLPKEYIMNSLEDIARTTVMSHNLELLRYLVDNYKLDLKKVSYNTPNKNYSLLEQSESVLKSMSEKLTRKREMTFFADELLYGENNYDRIIKKAYDRLNEFESEIEEIKEYNNYIKKEYEK